MSVSLLLIWITHLVALTKFFPHFEGEGEYSIDLVGGDVLDEFFEYPSIALACMVGGALRFF